MAYPYSLITGISGVLQSAINAAGGGGGTSTGIIAVVNTTGAFTVSGSITGPFGYSWSGNVGTYGTGTLATPSSLSGYSIIVKNRSTGGYLLLSGSVDYGTNWTVTPMAAVRLWSDSSTWLTI